MSADKDLISVQQARDLVEAAHRAQAELARFDQAKIDRICAAMAQAALRESPRVAALAVEETGYGIPADQLPLLFTKYHRVPGQASKGVVGTGLGLLIVKEIINAHGGTVEVESPGRNQGTTFVVRLPLHAQPVP